MSGLAAGFGLLSLRLWALLRVQALWRAGVGPSWELVAAGLAATLSAVLVLSGGVLGGGVAWPGQGGQSWLVAAGFELLLGTVLGLLLSLPGWALLGAGRVSEATLELRTNVEGGTLARVLALGSMVAALRLGLHGPLLGALAASVERFPIAAPLAWTQAVPGDLGELAVWTAEATALALAVATPALLVHALVELGLGALGRGPEPAGLLARAMAPGLRFAAALLALAAAWSAFPEAFARGVTGEPGAALIFAAR